MKRFPHSLFLLPFALVSPGVFAQTTAGEWDLAPWSYTGASSVIHSSTVVSSGDPEVGLSVTSEASGSYARHGLKGVIPGVFFSILTADVQPGDSVSLSSVTRFSFDQSVNFGPAAGQSIFLAKSNGFGFIIEPFTSHPAAAAITISLEGGAVFGETGGSNPGKFELVSGGAGFDTATFVWNPALDEALGNLTFDKLILLGDVRAITLTQSISGVAGTISNAVTNVTFFHVSNLSRAEDGAPFSIPALSISPARELSWPSRPETLYQLQVSEDLATWTDSGEPVEGTGDILTAVAPLFNDRGFYRLKVSGIAKE